MKQLDIFVTMEQETEKTVEEKLVTITSKNNDAIIETSHPSNAVKPAIKTSTKKQPAENIPNKRGRKSFKEIDAEAITVEVPDDDELFKKQYYAISKVAKWFNVNQSLLRYWENEFTILKPRKTKKGDRLFRPEDVKNLQLIYYLLRQRKFSIEGARQYLKDNKNKADKQLQLVQSLTKFRAFLLEWSANLDA